MRMKSIRTNGISGPTENQPDANAYHEAAAWHNDQHIRALKLEKIFKKAGNYNSAKYYATEAQYHQNQAAKHTQSAK